MFNRGQIINIGFNEYSSQSEFFFTHDIDIIPTEDCVKDIYTITPSNNTIMGILTSDCNTLGGIIKFNSESFINANGFPNNMWGWGVEDKALQNRVETMDINIKKNIIASNTNPLQFANFLIRDDVNDRHQNKDFNSRTQFEYDIFKNLGKERKITHIMSSGLNNLQYEVLSRENLNEYVELIKVNVS